MIDERLETFLAVAELRSFSRAAARLHISQAAVSQRVRTLERERGVALFRRGGRTVELTAAGHVLIEYARRIHDLSLEAAEALAALHPGAGDAVRLGIARSASYQIERLFPLLGSLDRPLNMCIRVGSNTQVVEQLRRADLDLGVLTGEAHLSLDGVSAIPLGSTEIVGVGPGREPEAQTPLRAFCRQPLILRERGAFFRGWLQHALERLGVATGQLHVVLEANEWHTIVAAVSAGFGYAFLPEWALGERQAAVRNVRVFRFPERILQPAHLVYNASLLAEHPSAGRLVEVVGRGLSDPGANRASSLRGSGTVPAGPPGTPGAISRDRRTPGRSPAAPGR